MFYILIFVSFTWFHQALFVTLEIFLECSLEFVKRYDSKCNKHDLSHSSQDFWCFSNVFIKPFLVGIKSTVLCLLYKDRWNSWVATNVRGANLRQDGAWQIGPLSMKCFPSLQECNQIIMHQVNNRWFRNHELILD